MPTDTQHRGTTSHRVKSPTPKQLTFLRTLTQRTGQTFVPPQTMAEASKEIKRLLTVKPDTADEIRQERNQIRDDMATQRGDAASVRADEVDGHGSSAQWAQRRYLGRYLAADGRTWTIYARRADDGVRIHAKPDDSNSLTDRWKFVATGLHLVSEMKAAVHAHLKDEAVDILDLDDLVAKSDAA